LKVAFPNRERRNGETVEQRRRWLVCLAGIGLVGLIIRVLFAVKERGHPLAPDAALFFKGAASLANGHGYTQGPGTPATAAHPPFFSMVMAVFDFVGFSSVDSQRIVVAVLSTTGVILMGFVGKRVGGRAVGLTAAAIAAVSPLWFQSPGILMSESIYLVVIPLILLLAFRCLDRPSVLNFVLLGVAIGIGVLTRSDALGLIVILGIPVVLFATKAWGVRGILALAMLVSFGIVFGSWLVRNEIQLGGAVLQTDEGITLAGSYCAPTLDPHQSSWGEFNPICADVAAYQAIHAKPPSKSEVTLNDRATSYAESFIRGHLNSVPGVMAAHEVRAWVGTDLSYQLAFESGEGFNPAWERAGMIMYWVLLPFVVVGLVLLVRTRPRELIVVASPIVVAVLNVAIFYGSIRMRTAAEPSLAIMSSVGLVYVFDRVREGLLKTKDTATARPSARATASD
jgi:4-amino-4-deoxy-L-arabinose transferase-like glycosyltransferase